jgi:hypothetical protein
MGPSSTGMKEAHFTAWTPAGIIRRQEVHDRVGGNVLVAVAVIHDQC